VAKIFPFKGIVYNKKVIDNLNKVMAPPYDVISQEEQEKLYASHPYNIVRLILGKEFPGDNESNNKYVRAERFFASWLKHGLLAQDEEPAIYVYEQTYLRDKKKVKRIGFFSLLRLEDFDRGKVLPHEETFSKAKLDRLELMRVCSSNFESIFSIFSDHVGYVEKIMKKHSRKKPAIHVKDPSGTLHSIWKIVHKGDIKRIIKALSDKTVFIADGHHRYEASLRYRDEMKDKYQKFTGEELYNHILMYFTAIEGKGLTIFPIHRVVRGIPDLDIPSFEDALKEYFDIELFPFTKRTEPKVRKKLTKLMEKLGDKEHVFGMLLEGMSQYYLLKLKDEKAVDRFVKDGKPKEWKRLDVTILHALVINHVLGLTTERVASEEHISYVKGTDNAVDRVLKGGNQIVFLLNPTKVAQIVKIANDKEKMPQKSTFFYPKLLSGILMNKIFLDEKLS
jgi:uncharacterized protein (DUF1015 family)